MKKTPLVLVLVSASVALTLGACSVSGHSHPETYDPSTFAASSYSKGAYALPLDPVISPGKTQAIAIHDAEENLVSACMNERGFRYEPEASTYDPSNTSRWYGVVDPEEAAVYGYRPPSLVEQKKSLARKSNETASRDATFVAAYGGTDATQRDIKDDRGAVIAHYDPKSCWGQAKDAIEPDWGKSLVITKAAESIASNAATTAEASREVQDGFADWSRCMKTKGFTFSDPWAANNSVWPGDTAGAKEIKTAVADAECKQSTGLLKTWSGQIAARQLSALAKQPGIVTEWQAMNKKAVDRANADGK